MGALAEVLAVLNAWADADLARWRAEHAELSAKVLPRFPDIFQRRARERRAGRAMPEPIGPQRTIRLTRPRCFVCGEPGHYRNRCPQVIGLADEV